jgi:hypothetical protein
VGYSRIHELSGAKFSFLLQRDLWGLATQNNGIKFQPQAMEQQMQLRDGE